MQHTYHSLGMPMVCPRFVAIHEDALMVIAPPQFPSFLYMQDTALVTRHPFQVGNSIMRERFWLPRRVFPVLTLFHEGVWKVWSTGGLFAVNLSTWHDLAASTTEAIAVEAWQEEISLEEVQATLGYASTLSSSPTIAECLLTRSNDYGLIAQLFTFLTGIDLVYGDASQLDLGNCSSSLSIVIPCYNAHDTLHDVIDSVYRSSRLLPEGVSCEIIIVDDNSAIALEKEQFPVPVKLVRSYQQLSCGGARNVGLSLAQGSVVLFLDADTILAPNYLINHWLRHHIFPGFLLISLREYLRQGTFPHARMPVLHQDSRWRATYTPAWLGLYPVDEEITVQPLADSENFRYFGNGRTIGPTDLPFMVKGNNLSVTRAASLAVRFPPSFEGWGPEDVCFGAKLIAQGHFVVPILSTGVFHMNHPPRSGSELQKQRELRANLQRYRRYLYSEAFGDWEAVK